MAVTPHHGSPICAYEIDAAGDLVVVDDGWCRFARDNGAPALADRAALYGRRLLAFISEPTTRSIYEALITRVIATGEAVRVPFRCDAPAFRRWLELEMTPRVEGGVRFTTRQLRGEPREPPLVVDAGAPAGAPLVRMCSWCKDVEITRGWARVEDAIAALQWFAGARVRGITHTICPGCIDRFGM